MASKTALHQRSIQPPEPRKIVSGPIGKIRRLDWTDLNDEGHPAEKVTFENISRRNFRALLKDPDVISIQPISMGPRGNPKDRTVDQRPDWLREIEEGENS